MQERAAERGALAALLDGLPVGVFRTTPDGRMLEVNARIVRMMGYDARDEFLAVPVPTLYADPADRARWRSELERHGELRAFETRLRRRDGSVLWGSVSAYAHRDASGNVLWYDGVVEDITQRKAQEEALARTDALLRAVFDALEDAVIVVSWPAREIVHVNRACERMYGYALEELRGRSTELFHVDAAHFAEFGERIGALMASQGDAHLEWRMRRRDGTIFPTAHVTALLRAPDGSILGGVAVTRDLSRQHEAERELAEARSRLHRSEKLAALGSLVAGLAHETRTPLAYLANHLAVLERRVPDDAVALESVAAMRDGVERINALVTSLRRYVRTQETGRRLLRLAPLVDEAVEIFSVASRGRIQVQVRHAPHAPTAYLEPTQVQQVVLNLLENAADAMPQGGLVEVATGGDTTAAELRVRDHGPGIDPAARGRLFEPFFTTKPDGTGLGLAIVRRLAEAHGARVEVESEPGRGATFVVRFPAAGAAPDAPA